MGQKTQYLQHKLQLSRITSRAASNFVETSTTSPNVYDVSVCPAIGKDIIVEKDAGDPQTQHMQLHNSIVRALLVDEVLHEPTRLMKRSRRAVAIITGADLVLVKTTKAISTGSTAAWTNSTGTTEGSSDGGSAADLAQATVLAQHELNKLVKCEVRGNRLELEFIVTGSARFKVSAAALGFSSSSCGGTDTATAAPTSASSQLDAAACRIASAPAAAHTTAMNQTEPELTHEDNEEQEQLPARRAISAPSAVQDSGAGMVVAVGTAENHAASPARVTTASSTALIMKGREASCHEGLQQRQTSALPETAAVPTKTLQQVGTTPTAGRSSSGFLRWNSGQLDSTKSAGIGSRSYVRQLGSSMIEKTSKTVSSSRLVKTDEGDYWVSVESFTLQFRDATICKLAAGLLTSGRSSMRVALDWVKQGLPFNPEFAISHITELSHSRAGAEVLVAGATPWGTELQLPDSWTAAIRTAQLPEDQPLTVPLQVADGPAAFKLHIATPAGLAEATLLPEMLALLARQANPQHTGQLLAVPVRLHLPAEAEQPIVQQQEQQKEMDDQEQQQAEAGSVQESPPKLNSAVEVGTSSSPRSASSSITRSSSSSSYTSGTDAEEQLQALGQDDLADTAYPVPDAEGRCTDGDLTNRRDAACTDQDGSYGCGRNGSNSSANSVKGILKHVSNHSSCIAGHDNLTASVVHPTATPLKQHVGWSQDTTDAQQVHGDRRFDANWQVSASLATAYSVDMLSTHSQHHGCVGFRSAAKRAAKKLIRKVSSRSFNGYAADRTLSGPPGGESYPPTGSNSAARMFRRSKSNPEGMLRHAAVAADRQGDARCDTDLMRDVSGAAGSCMHVQGGKDHARVHRFASSGELLPLRDSAVHDTSAPDDIGAAGKEAVPHGCQADSTSLAAQPPQSALSPACEASSKLCRSDTSSNGKVIQQHPLVDNEEQRLSFLPETYAVIHVQLVASSGSTTASDSNDIAAQPAIGEIANSPFAAVAVNSIGEEEGGIVAAAAPSVLVLGNDSSSTPPAVLTTHEQQLLSSLGLLAGLCCGLAMLLLHTLLGRLLVVAAALLNALCMIGLSKPGLIKRAVRNKTRMDAPVLASAPSLLSSSSITAGVRAAVTSVIPDAAHRTSQPERESDCCVLPDQAAASSVTIDSLLVSGGLRLRLLGGGFVKEALGLLEEQILAYKRMCEQELGNDAAAELSDALRSADVAEAAALAAPASPLQAVDSFVSDAVVLVSSPEPEWMTPDWKRRIIIARPNLEERRKVASNVDAWRSEYAAHKLLCQQPAHFEFFHQHLALRPLLVTPQGYVVVLLKVQSLVQVSSAIAAVNLSMSDMITHCGFLWSFMFEVLAPHRHPAGRLIMVADMSGLKLGQALGEGQAGARALGEVCFAWPERLCRCLVLGTPTWFNMLYRMVRPHLSPNTRAKVQVCDSSDSAAELARCLGAEYVPKEFGGPCTLSYEEYPAQQQLLRFVKGLQRTSNEHADV